MFVVVYMSLWGFYRFLRWFMSLCAMGYKSTCVV